MYRQQKLFNTFDSYRNYLESHKDEFPEHIYEFAANEERHNLTSPHSLHDSWLSALTIKEHRNTESESATLPDIELSLLGQMHDRKINISYVRVHSYSIVGTKNPYNWADTFHGDISSHAITLHSKSKFMHEILFSSGSKIQIEFEDFQCTEVACT